MLWRAIAHSSSSFLIRQFLEHLLIDISFCMEIGAAYESVTVLD
jgi:hypothetical protein